MGDISREAESQTNGASLAEHNSILQPLADELMAIALKLRGAALGEESEGASDPSARPRTQRSAHASLVLARKAYALRRKREAIFGNPDLFGEPAWDILLDLFIAQGESKPVSVSSACIGSAAPATTGLRWLGVLADQGLVVRENDPEDHRRVLVRLTQAGRAAMERFFDAVDQGL